MVKFILARTLLNIQAEADHPPTGGQRDSQQQQQQTKTMKHNTIPKLGASLLVALGLTAAANAAAIVGGISFAGGFIPQDSASAPVANLTSATQIAFVNPGITIGAGSGTFSIIPAFSPVTMATPLVFVPPTLPGGNLWSVTNGGHTFTFAMTSMTVDPIDLSASPLESMAIHGAGTVSYVGPAGPFTPSNGTWVATFNTGGGTFSWSSSAASTPDGGTTMALFGVSLLGLGAIRRKLLKH